jgi:hypothetical protein
MSAAHDYLRCRLGIGLAMMLSLIDRMLGRLMAMTTKEASGCRETVD